MKKILRVWESVLDVLFPPVCLVCENSLDSEWAKKFICRNCLVNIELNTNLVCPKCGGRISEISSSCRCRPDYVLAAGAGYDDLAVKKLIWQLKFKNQRKAVLALAAVAVAFLEKFELPLDDFVLIPVPLFSRRLRARGFNQSELLGRALADYLGLKIFTKNLVRLRSTESQIGFKTLVGRRRNIAGCFGLVNSSDIRGKNVVLVDDVWTTGATMNEAARCLRGGGAKKIIGLVVAKA